MDKRKTALGNAIAQYTAAAQAMQDNSADLQSRIDELTGQVGTRGESAAKKGKTERSSEGNKRAGREPCGACACRAPAAPPSGRLGVHSMLVHTLGTTSHGGG